jgi:hypothetical protein
MILDDSLFGDCIFVFTANNKNCGLGNSSGHGQGSALIAPHKKAFGIPVGYYGGADGNTVICEPGESMTHIFEPQADSTHIIITSTRYHEYFQDARRKRTLQTHVSNFINLLFEYAYHYRFTKIILPTEQNKQGTELGCGQFLAGATDEIKKALEPKLKQIGDYIIQGIKDQTGSKPFQKCYFTDKLTIFAAADRSMLDPFIGAEWKDSYAQAPNYDELDAHQVHHDALITAWETASRVAAGAAGAGAGAASAAPRVGAAGAAPIVGAAASAAPRVAGAAPIVGAAASAAPRVVGAAAMEVGENTIPVTYEQLITICNFAWLQSLVTEIMKLLTLSEDAAQTLITKINEIPNALTNIMVFLADGLNNTVLCERIIQPYNTIFTANIAEVKYFSHMYTRVDISARIVAMSKDIQTNVTNILNNIISLDRSKMIANSVFIFRLYGAYLFILYIIYYAYSYINLLISNDAVQFDTVAFGVRGIEPLLMAFNISQFTNIITNLHHLTTTYNHNLMQFYDVALSSRNGLQVLLKSNKQLLGHGQSFDTLFANYKTLLTFCKSVEPMNADTYKRLIIKDRAYILSMSPPSAQLPPPSAQPPPSAPAQPQPQHQPPSMMRPPSQPLSLSRGQPQASVPKPPSVLLPSQPIYTPSISDIFTICANESDETKKRTHIRNYLATPIDLPTLGAHPVRDAAAPADAANPSTWLFP